MRIYEKHEPGPAIETFYDEVLKASFPATELVDLQEFQDIAASDEDSIWLIEDEDGTILGGATAEWDASLRVLLLGYLAIRPGTRGGGLGGSLYMAALESWREKYKPCLILAEVQDPAGHSSSEAYGDPAARLRFYLSRGSRILDLPYFQPALAPGLDRVSDELLVVLHADPELSGTRAGTVKADVVREFLEQYQIQYEGRIGADPQAMDLWRALDRPDGVPFRAA
jgi:GNAT superfamily N-acetyltransferase